MSVRSPANDGHPQGIAEEDHKPEDIGLLIELGEAVKIGSICGLGHSSASPMLTSIRYTRQAYEAHIYRKEWMNAFYTL